jgi:LmbE family N-acetylglucosaminyl deacetylase
VAALGRGFAPRTGGGSTTILALTPTTDRRPREGPLRLLLLGAHCDDIEIGVGGALLEWRDAGVSLAVDWVVFTSTPERAQEARGSAEAFLGGAVDATITIHDFRDGFLPYEGAPVKEAFEALKDRVDPDLVFTHARDDRHQDHRMLSDLAWNTFRDHLVFEYEIPKYDGDLGQPNAFVAITERNVQRKWDYLAEHYRSQADRPWFTESTIRALMRLRGIEARADSGYAEAFHARKVTVDLAPPPAPAEQTSRQERELAVAQASGSIPAADGA